MVPVLRGGKKDGSESVNEESTKQVWRKTKWGPDLTQDTTVRKGRALAYQVFGQCYNFLTIFIHCLEFLFIL